MPAGPGVVPLPVAFVPLNDELDGPSPFLASGSPKSLMTQLRCCLKEPPLNVWSTEMT